MSNNPAYVESATAVDAAALKQRFANYTDGANPQSSSLDRDSRTLESSLLHSEGSKNMADITRDEFNAKLETIEVRMDGRVASIEAKIEGFMGRLEEKFSRMDDRMTHIERDLSDNKNEIAGQRQEFKSLKTTMITTGIGSVLAIVLGVAAFNATVLSNMVASFESGKSTAAAQAEVKRQSEETAALLKQIQGQINQAPPVKK